MTEEGAVYYLAGSEATEKWERLEDTLKGNRSVLFMDQRRFISAYSESIVPLLSAVDPLSYLPQCDRPYCYAMFVINPEKIACKEIKYPAIPELSLPEQQLYDYSIVSDVKNTLLLPPTLDSPEKIIVNITSPTSVDLLEEGVDFIVSGNYSPVDKERDPYYAEGNFSEEELLNVLSVSSNIIATTQTLQEDGSYTDTYNPEDYREIELPTISRLTENVDVFLNREENALWSMALERFNITQQSLTVLGVYDLNSLPMFNARTAYIVSGRNFNSEEANEGARVCVISAALANANGLKTGDTIPLRFYLGTGDSPYSDEIPDRNPTVNLYNPYEDFLSETLTYEIVGLYGTQELWSNSAYAFTPNTVFVPNASIPSAGLFAEGGLYTSVVLKNGNGDDFLESLSGTEYENTFLVLDQGYQNIEPILNDLTRNGIIILLITSFVFVAIVLLYIILVVGREKADAGRMLSLGTEPKDVRNILIARSMLPAILAALIGGTAGLLLRGAAVDTMLSTVAEQAARVTVYTDMALSGEDYLLAAQRSLQQGAAALPILLALIVALFIIGGAVALQVNHIGKTKTILLIKEEG